MAVEAIAAATATAMAAAMTAAMTAMAETLSVIFTARVAGIGYENRHVF